jgi:hypothetical protein
MLEKLLKSVPVIGATDARLMLIEEYETNFGIYDHNLENADHPLALLEMHPMEDTVTCSLMYERIEQFAQVDVSKRFGLNFIDFLSLPRDYCEKMLEVASKMKGKEDADAAAMLKNLQNAGKTTP